MRLWSWLSLCLVIACRTSSETSGSGGVPAAKPEAAAVAAAAPTVHGEKWKNTGEEERPTAGFQLFKEVWVYADGRPVGVISATELPPLPEVWIDDLESLDFKPGQPGPKERAIKVLRWRLRDYLAALGIDVAAIQMIYLHGGSGVVDINAATWKKFGKDITFDLTGVGGLKVRFYLPDKMPRETSFDRYSAVSVLLKKEPLPKNHDNDLVAPDGKLLDGIPYHVQPQRCGVRVYLDGKLATVIKRNLLGAVGRLEGAEPMWDLRLILGSVGASTAEVVAGDFVFDSRRQRLDEAGVKDLRFTTSSQRSGELLIGPDRAPAQAILLYSAGKVPPLWTRPQGME
jgi:hypothetical protein